MHIFVLCLCVLAVRSQSQKCLPLYWEVHPLSMLPSNEVEVIARTPYSVGNYSFKVGPEKPVQQVFKFENTEVQMIYSSNERFVRM